MILEMLTESYEISYQAPHIQGLVTFIASYVPSLKSGRIDMIDIHPSYEGRGVGSQTVRCFEDWVKKQGGIYVTGFAAFNSSKFWKKVGYSVSSHKSILGGVTQGYKIKKFL